MSTTLTRSTLLKAGGAVVVAFGFPLPLRAAEAVAPGRPDAAQLDSWLAVSRDGTVTAFTGRIDFGQRKRTAFAQIVAEELDVPFESVVMVMGDTSLTVSQGPSTASDGILDGAKPLRHAAAEARRVLLDLASKKFDVPASELVVNKGIVSIASDPSKKVSYGELIGNRQFNTTLKVTNYDKPTLDAVGIAQPKDPSQYKIVGKSIPAAEIPKKVTATWPRVHNVRLPGMLHARLILPPAPGAHVTRVGSMIPHAPDIVGVIHKGDFVAVVAKTEWAAIRGAESLDVDWTSAQTLPGNDGIFNYLRTAHSDVEPETVLRVGDVDAALAGASKVFSAAYNYPSQNHGMIGPSCGVADVRGNEATVYSGTQDAAKVRSSIAKLLDLPEQMVRVLPYEPSGCYGRLGLDDATVAAAFLSQQLRKPVRVQMMRGQEHTWEPLQPPSTFSFRAAVDTSGKIAAWDHQEWTWGFVGEELPVMLIPRGQIEAEAPPHVRPPGGGENSAYGFAAARVVGHAVPPLLRGLYMRSPGRIQVNFAGEQFMDEIAAATGQDALAFRLRHVTDERTVAVLNEAARAANWQTRPSPGPDARSRARIARGRGIAVVANQRSTYVATVAEVEVDRQTGNVRVRRMTAAVDPGLVVNPDGIRAQIEGATIYATSRALKEEVKYGKSKVTTADWLSYPILRFTEVPEIQIALINRPTVPPGGIGEPPNTTPPAAIGNAIYDAIGVRIRELPYTPARVKAALA
ncbi:MAG TPA: molybdopterin cofactor-binding domain-containing protein [Candidatus Binatia bacterium]|nr:molybdopterin cofactor-binding domain-containing protein [Candidatus Binatia bacterium]